VNKFYHVNKYITLQVAKSQDDFKVASVPYSITSIVLVILDSHRLIDYITNRLIDYITNYHNGRLSNAALVIYNIYLEFI